MKKSSILLIGLCTLLFASVMLACSDDDDSKEPITKDATNLILDVSFDGVDLSKDLEIDHEEGEIFAYTSTIIKKLTPQISVSEGAVINPPDNKEYDFSEPKVFTVISTKGDGERKYTIHVDLDKRKVSSFKLATNEVAYDFSLADGIITEQGSNKYEVRFKVNATTDITSMVPKVAKNESVTLEPAENVAYDFSQPKTFKLKDGEEVLAEYKVVVEQIKKVDRIWNQQNLSQSHDGIEFLNCNTAFKLDCSQDVAPYFNEMIPFNAYAVKIDMSKGYHFETQLNSSLKSVSGMVSGYNANNSKKAIIGINGGYFGSNGASYSLLINKGKLMAKNIAALARSSRSYYVTRGAFGIDADNKFSADWVYHINDKLTYGYPTPSENIPGENPKAVPDENYPSNGFEYSKSMAVGGGPVLVRDSKIVSDYTYELFQSDITRYLADRTCIGVDADGKLVIVLVEGRQDRSAGVSLEDLADIMRNDFNCTHAMNLDGGGSSTLIIDGQLINKTSGGGTYQRPVSTGVLITK
ncbi:MAG: phosphodiester glycosidase family protein [Carboxylicivirga sp.]|jgi:exopolysaccharide biosynthesis protein|nr:phosphodiester glycosidase family protein [Carboxylicivirga sp.]